MKETPAASSSSRSTRSHLVTIDSLPPNNSFRTILGIGGMSCSACVSSITQVVEGLPFVQSVHVSLLTNSAAVIFEGEHHRYDIASAVEQGGFDCIVLTTEKLLGTDEKMKQKGIEPTSLPASQKWQAEFAISGMTCSACVNAVTATLEGLSVVSSVSVNLITNSAIVCFEGKDNLPAITEAIEDTGFEAAVMEFHQFDEKNPDTDPGVEREISIRVDGMYRHHCPGNIVDQIRDKYGTDVAISDPKVFTLNHPILKLQYIPQPPNFTIRDIFTTIESRDTAFKVSVYHQPTIEDRSKISLAKERKAVLLRLGLSVAAAIPTFIIGVVATSILKSSTQLHKFMAQPMWAGSISRAEWALCITATPVYLFAADVFHRKALKEIRALWRRGSTISYFRKFTRFGSMNMLLSLATTIAYFSSIADMIIQGTQSPSNSQSESDPDSKNYFDSVVFLTMFLIMGRVIEAYTKQKTGDAVAALGKLRPSEAILLNAEDGTSETINSDLLEVGDTVLLPSGSSPPFDGIIISGISKFDESSLTGESKPVKKATGDQVFSGTINKVGPVTIRLTSISGSTMLDHIIRVVREGQGKRAPIERIADRVTRHFVPFVVLVGIFTWFVWLGLGLDHKLPQSWLQSSTGGWPLWALQFAIAVFVVACPCGIGLAAPTALFVGGGLAAKHGILAKGGGEAFQEASKLDYIVFDKTGTLTKGSQLSVIDHLFLANNPMSEVSAMVSNLETNSQHPVAAAVVKFCAQPSNPKENYTPSELSEIPGKGLRGRYRRGEGFVDLIIGNEALILEHKAKIDPSFAPKILEWKQSGFSIVLVGYLPIRHVMDKTQPRGNYTVITALAIADHIRLEAKQTIEALKSRGISVWMLSGDNHITAQAIGAKVGIPVDQIISEVLPHQKAEQIKHLQRMKPPSTKDTKKAHKNSESDNKVNTNQISVSNDEKKSKKQRKNTRALVAMVGDGINDSPALATADVGIAIGSGADVALASASFILVSSDLRALVTLVDLSRAVFQRVYFNFAWALVYNLIAMPIAAGVFYAVRTGNGGDGGGGASGDAKSGHVVLAPVWASLAMALSSVSVITSSLLLRTRWWVVGFRSQQRQVVGATDE